MEDVKTKKEKIISDEWSRIKKDVESAAYWNLYSPEIQAMRITYHDFVLCQEMRKRVQHYCVDVVTEIVNNTCVLKFGNFGSYK